MLGLNGRRVVNNTASAVDCWVTSGLSCCVFQTGCNPPQRERQVKVLAGEYGWFLATVGYRSGFESRFLCCVTLSKLLGLSEVATPSLSSDSVFRAQESAKTGFAILPDQFHRPIFYLTEAEKRTLPEGKEKHSDPTPSPTSGQLVFANSVSPAGMWASGPVICGSPAGREVLGHQRLPLSAVLCARHPHTEAV